MHIVVAHFLYAVLEFSETIFDLNLWILLVLIRLRGLVDTKGKATISHLMSVVFLLTESVDRDSLKRAYGSSVQVAPSNVTPNML